jgi:hypothetical protein
MEALRRSLETGPISKRAPAGKAPPRSSAAARPAATPAAAGKKKKVS